MKLFETEVGLMDLGSTPRQNLSNTCDQLFMLHLRQWTILPNGTGVGLPCHEVFLGSTQRILEARDAFMVAASFRNAQTAHAAALQAGTVTGPITLPMLAQPITELKNTLAVWRERMPNRWDPMSLWDTLFTWRHHVFTHVSMSFQVRTVVVVAFECRLSVDVRLFIIPFAYVTCSPCKSRMQQCWLMYMMHHGQSSGLQRRRGS